MNARKPKVKGLRVGGGAGVTRGGPGNADSGGAADMFKDRESNYPFIVGSLANIFIWLVCLVSL
jgi:hypothetical protein